MEMKITMGNIDAVETVQWNKKLKGLYNTYI